MENDNKITGELIWHTIQDIFASVFAGCPSALPVDAEKKQMDYAAGSRLPFFLDM